MKSATELPFAVAASLRTSHSATAVTTQKNIKNQNELIRKVDLAHGLKDILKPKDNILVFFHTS